MTLFSNENIRVSLSFEKFFVGSKESIPKDKEATKIANIFAMMESMIFRSSSNRKYTCIAESPFISTVVFSSLNNSEEHPNDHSINVHWINK